MMKKTSISLLVIGILVFSTAMSIGFDKDAASSIKGNTAGDRDYTHTVLGEEASATWCPHCPAVVGYMNYIYALGTYDFYYVTLVCDMNSYAYNRAVELGLTGYPTVFFDGGYQTLVGNQGSATPYQNALDTCGARTVPNVDLGMTVQWLGDAEMSVVVDVTNNQGSSYSGNLRVYVTEIVSRWLCYSTVYYDFAMIGNYAINMNVNVPAGETSQYTANWDGDTYGFGDITMGNIQLVATLLSTTSPNYVHETTAAVPTMDSPPSISNVQATPGTQVPGGLVNITATVTDDVGVDTVTAYITPPGGSSTGYPMTLASEDTYYYETSDTTTLGDYDFYISAQDTSGNEETSSVQSFTIWEYNPPSITDVQAIPLTGDQVTITCTVQDDTGVDIVKINITDPQGGLTEALMTPAGGDTYTYTGTFTSLGGYNYSITANDACGNINLTSPHVLMRQSMHSGWNLITIPFTRGWTAESLGANISGCSVVSMFDGSIQTFASHLVGSPHDDFPIENGVGYFIYVSTNSIFTATGAYIPSLSLPIYTEWNVVGWYHSHSTLAESLGDNIMDCIIVSMFNGSTQTFASHLVGSPHDNFPVTQGMGLFIYATSESTWQGEG